MVKPYLHPDPTTSLTCGRTRGNVFSGVHYSHPQILKEDSGDGFVLRTFHDENAPSIRKQSPKIGLLGTTRLTPLGISQIRT
jgi:hypothetical protein